MAGAALSKLLTLKAPPLRLRAGFRFPVGQRLLLNDLGVAGLSNLDKRGDAATNEGSVTMMAAAATTEGSVPPTRRV
jgi:hypothetical protein